MRVKVYSGACGIRAAVQGRSASGHDQIEELKRPAGSYALVTAGQREKLLLLSRHRCLRKKRKERGLGSSGGPELPSGSASLSERLRYGERAAPYKPSQHSRICFCRFAVYPSLIAASSISLQSRPLTPPSPPPLLSHHGRSLLVLAHHLLPQVLFTLYRLRNTYADAHLAESWYRLVRRGSPPQTRLSLTSAQNMPSTPSTKVSPP